MKDNKSENSDLMNREKTRILDVKCYEKKENINDKIF